MIMASAFLARSGADGPSAENRIAMVVFVTAILIALTMLARILWQSRRLRARK
jgi:ubiquinone biosynthesis protein